MDATIPRRTLNWLSNYTAKYRISLALIKNQKAIKNQLPHKFMMLSVNNDAD